MVRVYVKIIEIFVHDQIAAFFEENKLLYEHQYGFRKNKSTDDALRSVITDWREALGNDEFVIAVFLEFIKIF